LKKKTDPLVEIDKTQLSEPSVSLPRFHSGDQREQREKKEAERTWSEERATGHKWSGAEVG
jgi:hypothetical protein